MEPVNLKLDDLLERARLGDGVRPATICWNCVANACGR